MSEEDNEERRGNTVLTLMKNNHPGELMRSKIGAANGAEPEMDYHEGKGSSKSFEGFPKEYFTKSLDFKAKIDLILEKKALILDELILEIKVEKKEFLDCYRNNKIPKQETLSKLSILSGYPIDFFTAPPLMETTKNHHNRNVILASCLLCIIAIGVVFGVLYIFLWA